MIIYNNQLMPTTEQATLFMVSNPYPFKRFEDHEAAIYIQLHSLVEQSISEGQNPVLLIESYLETTYIGGQSIEEIATYLLQHDKMQSALWTLKDNWSTLDETIPGDSLMYGGMEKEEAIQVYSEITLMSYLEALASFENTL